MLISSDIDTIETTTTTTTTTTAERTMNEKSFSSIRFDSRC